VSDRSSDVLRPDGLALPEVGDWAEMKYQLVEPFSQMVSTSMKGKWTRVYIDLFAAAGWAQVKGSRRILRGTAVSALGVAPPFDRYVFCDIEPTLLEALKVRVSRDFPTAEARYVQGDCNETIDQVIAEMPGEGRSPSALSFCVVDPRNTGDLQFSTIERLAFVEPGVERRIDFLVLIPSFMDAHREQDYYLDPSSTRLAQFLGNPSWRDAWREEASRGHPRNFAIFLVDMFGQSMRRLGYRWDLENAILRANGQTNLYHLAFFSRNKLGDKFAREARKAASKQRPFLF
jgi:three-Cys-motif partner protein